MRWYKLQKQQVRTPPIPFRNDRDVFFIHFVNIGEGDCILREIPDFGGYKNFLIDLGRGGCFKLDEFRDKLKIGLIDYAIITHPNIDHCTDLIHLLQNNA